MNLYNKLSIEYDKLFEENIEAFRSNYKNARADQNYYLAFYPRFGSREKHCDFLIYGQAVKGWETGFSINPTCTDSSLEEIISCSNSYLSESGYNPIDFVNILWSKSNYHRFIIDDTMRSFYDKYNKGPQYLFCRSFFWNVTYKLICDYYGMDHSEWKWSEKMVWSNLYKIAPEDDNPSPEERQFQQTTAVELVKKEIDEIKPKYCIVLTNKSWWLPFRERLQPVSLEYNSDLDIIEDYMEYCGTKIIVTHRPYIGSNKNHVSQILSLIQNV